MGQDCLNNKRPYWPHQLLGLCQRDWKAFGHTSQTKVGYMRRAISGKLIFLLMLPIAVCLFGRVCSADGLLDPIFCESSTSQLGAYLGLEFTTHLKVCTLVGTDSLHTISARDRTGLVSSIVQYQIELSRPEISVLSPHSILIKFDRVFDLKQLANKVGSVDIHIEFEHTGFPQ